MRGGSRSTPSLRLIIQFVPTGTEFKVLGLQHWNILLFLLALSLFCDVYYEIINEKLSWELVHCYGSRHCPTSVQWTAVVVAGFPSLSSFVMVLFHRRPFAHLCALNPDSPGANTYVCSKSLHCCSQPSCWPPEVT